MAKNDRRVQYTKHVIKESLLKMMETTHPEQITVKSLCEEAGINRATFYSHYDTLTALLEELEVEESNELFSRLSVNIDDENYLEVMLKSAIDYMKKNPVMREVFLNKQVQGTGLSMLMQGHLNERIEQLSQHSKISRRQAGWIYLYIISGTRELLRYWFDTGMKNEELFIQTLNGFIWSGLEGFMPQE